MSNLKKEFKSFMDDIEKNVSNKEDLQFVKERVTDLFGVILDEMERITNYKEEKIGIMMQKQQEIEAKMDKMQHIIDSIEKDIYLDDSFDFEIVCPYCNAEFLVDIDEEKTEVTCPECNNVIELDWSGDVEDEDMGGCGNCPGCAPKKDEDDDM